MDVVGFGALNIDIICKVDFNDFSFIEKGSERKIRKGELSFLKNTIEKKAKFVVKSGGGSAANTIYALSKMGFCCGFVGKVGKDKEGDFILKELEEAKVDTSEIKREGKTGICFILVDERGERSVLVLPGVNDTLTPDEVNLDYIKEAKILHATSFVGDTSYITQKNAILKSENILSFDPGEPHASRGWEELSPIIKKTYFFFSTEKEIKLLTGKNFEEGCARLRDWGAKVVICKMGDKGSFLKSEKGEIFIPARKVKSIDTTGAGDVYAAGFLAGFLRGLSLKNCGLVATCAAAMSVTGYGREKYPDKNFLEYTIQNLSNENGS